MKIQFIEEVISSYTPDASFSEELTLLMLILMLSLFHNLHAGFSLEEFRFRSCCYFCIFFYTPGGRFCEE